MNICYKEQYSLVLFRIPLDIYAQPFPLFLGNIDQKEKKNFIITSIKSSMAGSNMFDHYNTLDQMRDLLRVVSQSYHYHDKAC